MITEEDLRSALVTVMFVRLKTKRKEAVKEPTSFPTRRSVCWGLMRIEHFYSGSGNRDQYQVG